MEDLSDAGAGPPARCPAPSLASPCSGWWILGAFAVAALAALTGVPEPVTAVALGLGFLAMTTWHSANGIAALVLASGFLLGEHKTPYFPLGHAAVLAVLLSFTAHRALGRLPAGPARLAPAVGFAAAAAVALPLDLRGLLEDLWIGRWLDWGTLAARGIPDAAHLKYLERVGVLALGAGLFGVASHPAVAPVTVATLAPLAAVVGGLSAFGLLRFFGAVQSTGQYLTLSFWTWQHPDLRLTAVAWNPDYVAQFLALTVPLALALGWSRGPTLQRALGAGSAILGTLALAFTFQRAAYVALSVALLALALLRWRGASRAGGPRWRASVATAAAVLLVVVAVDRTVLEGRVGARLVGFATDPNRIQLWTAALRMLAAEPMLGVGAGRYAAFFREYADPKALADFGPFWGTAHSTYLHVLAEQGVVGLTAFLVFFGGVWLAGLRRLSGLADERRVLAEGLLASLTGWFTYAALQYVFRVDALTYLVAILAGTLVALVRQPSPSRGRRWWLLAFGIGLGFLAVRLEAALQRPIGPGYEAGFYRWERQPGGGAARWTGGRAALATRVEGRVLVLALRAPGPDLAARPQVVTVWVDRRPAATVRLATPDWRILTMPVDRPRGVPVLVELETAYTFVPARLAPSRDSRRLGVMVTPLTWRDA